MLGRRGMLASIGSSGSAAMGLAPGSGSESASAGVGREISRSPNRIITRNGVSLFWREWGHGAPVLFVHAWALQSQQWDYQFAALGDAMRCIGFDRRGHGRSDCPPRGYDYNTLADDLADVIAALDLSGLTLVGHSMGAAEIVRYLTRHGSSRITRIVLIAPVLPIIRKTEDNPTGVPEAALRKLRAAWEADFPKWVVANTPPFFAPSTSAALMQWGSDMLLQTPLPVAIACNRTITDTDFRGELRRIGVPTLLIHGDHDVSAPIDRTGRPASELIQGCTFKVYEGAPHGLMFTHAERLHSDLRAFIGV